MKKETLKIIKEIAVIIFVPSIIVGAYHGWKYYKKKKDEKEKNNFKISNSKETKLDANGMLKYVIDIPSDDREKLFTNGEFFEAIKNIKYSFDNIGGGGQGIAVNIKMNPTELQKLKDAVIKLDSRIKVENA